MNLNNCQLIGRLTKNPELRNTQAGQSVATFSVATSRTWKDKSGAKQEKETFHNIVMWGKLAEIAGQWLTKGQEVFIEGRIETRMYEAKDGNKRYITEIVADNMQMGAKPKGYVDQGQQATAPTAQPAPQEEIPTINIEDDAQTPYPARTVKDDEIDLAQVSF